MDDVIIVGGGLAGCGAAIRLADAGFSVRVLEKRSYPEHKLCGEFLSPEVWGMLDRLGALEQVHNAGAHEMRRARLTASSGAMLEVKLPGVALGLSRYRLDAILADRARSLGAEVMERKAVREVTGSLTQGFEVETRSEAYKARVVLGAYGKRGVLDRTLHRESLQQQTPFVAFKAHFSGETLEDVIELHAFDGGYCGISHVEEGLVNACWITHEKTLKEADRSPEGMIERTFQTNGHLKARFDRLERVSDSFCAVSQISVEPKTMFDGDVCMIGDTAGMIAPMCGDGMAMALRSAELAVPHVQSFLRGNISASTFRTTYTSDWKSEFTTRMKLGRWAHHAYVQPWIARAGLGLCQLIPSLGRWAVRHTRG